MLTPVARTVATMIAGALRVATPVRGTVITAGMAVASVASVPVATLAVVAAIATAAIVARVIPDGLVARSTVAATVIATVVAPFVGVDVAVDTMELPVRLSADRSRIGWGGLRGARTRCGRCGLHRAWQGRGRGVGGRRLILGCGSGLTRVRFPGIRCAANKIVKVGKK